MDLNLAYCPACNRDVKDFRPGGGRGKRPRARCPHCGALERHRFLALILDGLAPGILETGRVLDIAPSPYVSSRMERIGPDRYVRMDLDPAADGRSIEVQASLTQLPFADESFDLIVCYHVLEHVPDDAQAMRELVRVLSRGGLALMQVPFRPGTITDEDPEAPVEERIRRFGQADHVRWYGDDLEARLSAAGLAGARIRVADVLSESAAHVFAIPQSAVVWLLRASNSAELQPVHPCSGFRLQTVNDLVALAAKESQERAILQRDLDRAVEKSESYRLRYERIRHHPIIDATARLTRPVRRFTRREQ